MGADDTSFVEHLRCGELLEALPGIAFNPEDIYARHSLLLSSLAEAADLASGVA